MSHHMHQYYGVVAPFGSWESEIFLAHIIKGPIDLVVEYTKGVGCIELL